MSNTMPPPGMGSASTGSVVLSPGTGLPFVMPGPAPLPNLTSNIMTPSQTFGAVPQVIGGAASLRMGGAAGDLNIAAANTSASAVSPVIAPFGETSETIDAAS